MLVRRPFVVLGLIVAFVAAGCGSGEEETTTVTVTQTETETVTRTVTTAPSTGSTAECSASGVSADLPSEPEVPTEVAEVREEIAAAAVACDYERLQELALEEGTGFTFSYGAETSAADYWAGAEERGEEVMRILVETLRGGGHLYQGHWVWPAAYTDEPTDADWQALAGIYPQELIDSFRENGSFLGYRVGITPSGDWQFFVAGD